MSLSSAGSGHIWTAGKARAKRGIDMAKKIYVGNMSYNTSEDTLRRVSFRPVRRGGVRERDRQFASPGAQKASVLSRWHPTTPPRAAMGLNLDVDHVAFASDRKFDGYQFRRLNPANSPRSRAAPAARRATAASAPPGAVRPSMPNSCTRLKATASSRSKYCSGAIRISFLVAGRARSFARRAAIASDVDARAAC